METYIEKELALARKTFRKIITNPKILENINSKNKNLKSHFLKYKKLTASSTTVSSYGSDLDIFFSYLYLKNGNKFFIDLKKYDIIEFFSYAKDTLQWGSSRSNRMRSTLSSLSLFIERVLDDSWPQFKNIILQAVASIPKDSRREKSVFTEEEVQSVLDNLSKKDAQMACWFSLAASSGMRFSELLRVNVSTIENAKDAFNGLFLYTEPITSKGRGGNRKDNKYILKDDFMEHYVPWKEERENLLSKMGVEGEDSLFIKKDGSPATSGTARSWVKKIDKITSKHFYTHLLRHWITTRMSLNGIPRELIQAILQWKSSDMVGLYDDSDIQDREFEELDALRK